MTYIDKFYEIKDRQASVTKDNVRQYTRTFYTLTTDPLVDPKIVEDNFVSVTGIVRGTTYQTAYSTDPYSKALSIRTNCTGGEDGKEYETAVQYGKMDSTGDSIHPLMARVKYTSNFSLINKPVDWDFYMNVPIVNTVDDAFNPPLEEGFPYPVLQFVRNEAYPFNERRAAMYVGSMNGDWWLGNAPLTCHCKHLGHVDQEDQVYGPFITVTYQVALNLERWVRKVLNTGLRAKHPTTDKVVPINSGGHPITTPRQLDKNGYEVPRGSPPSAAHWLYFYTKKVMPFSPVLNF
jgi:hypothetical protein